MREIINFNHGWSYTDTDFDNAQKMDFVAVNWNETNLPHDYSTEHTYKKEASTKGTCGFVQTGVLWYRKAFYLTDEEASKTTYLEFGSVFMNSDVWINGEHLGTRPYGYISFAYELTRHLRAGLNIVCVRVDCSEQQQSRWYNGCGIYQDVKLVRTEKTYVMRHGSTVVTNKISDDTAHMSIKLDVVNDNDVDNNCEISFKVVSKQSGEVLTFSTQEKLISGINIIEKQFEIESAELWSPEHANLYTIVATISCDGVVIDEYPTEFGVRVVELIPNKGFYLNKVNYKLKGCCLHHDSGVMGAIFSESVWKKRLEMLKEMGCNAIRTSHNPFDTKFYQMCSEMGFFVIDELFDGWDQPKAPHDYGKYFDEWYKQDTAEFIGKNKNFPCIIMWSIGNEIPNISEARTQELLDLFHKYDPTRAVTCGVPDVTDIHDKCRALLDVAGYNDGSGACFIYNRDHEKRPNQLMVATESPHTTQTRGFYRTQTYWRDHNQPREEIANLCENELFFDGHESYRSSYDNCGVRWNIRDTWNNTLKLDYLIGEFRWTGIDYYGESAGWPLRKMESGVIDTANFAKDHYYLLQSLWTDSSTAPMVHIVPHWTHDDIATGTEVPIIVYTNCEKAELFLNDVSLGVLCNDIKTSMQWNVPYSCGTLKAIAYNGDKVMAQTEVTTATAPSKLALSVAWQSVNDGINPVQIDCAVLDANGNFVPYADSVVSFTVSDSCRFVGTENGDPADMTALFSNKRKAFYGLCAATIIPKSQCDVEITASAILGKRYFSDTNTVSIAVAEINGASTDEKYQIYYSVDTSKPSVEYSGEILLSDTTLVKAEIFKDGVLIDSLEELFVKGEQPKLPLHTHGNKCVLTEFPPVTPCEELQGRFNDGAFDFEFRQTGEFVRVLNEELAQHIGYWHYDSKKTDESALGMGEIWFDSGEKESFVFEDNTFSKLILDNSQGGFRVFRLKPQIIFTKNI